MARTKPGDIVRIRYRGRPEDDSVHISPKVGDLQFKVGEGEVIHGLEKAVIGMRPGDSKTTKIQAHEAFGPDREELVVELERHQLPRKLEPRVGQLLSARYRDDSALLLRVADVSDTRVVLDGNHPLAGKDLKIELELLEILRN